MASRIQRVGCMYSKFVATGNDDAAKRCKELLTKYGVFEQVKYRLEKYGITAAQ